MAEPADALRARRLVDRAIAEQRLDLTGLRVLTEAATGHYAYTAALAARAGAEVVALAADSPYGSGHEVAAEVARAAASLEVAVRCTTERSAEVVGWADIVTNTGPLRPIDARLVGWMRPTAVVPLMWETWEWRPEELDLDACQREGVLCLGTREGPAPLDFEGYLGATALRLLFELGLEVHKTELLVVGGGLGDPVVRSLRRFGLEPRWVADAPGADLPLDALSTHWVEAGARYDAVLVAEHRDPRRLLGDGGLLEADELARVQPAVRVGVISGAVDGEALRRAGIPVVPERLRPPGYMSFQPAVLGPRPVLELYAAGLRVGEVMARSRRSGMSPRDSARVALDASPAMDFPGPRAWLSPGR